MKKHFEIAVRAGLVIASAMLVGMGAPARAANQAQSVTLAQNGVAQAAIYVAPAVMEADKVVPPNATPVEGRAETDRRRLRESVKDLALYFGKMSGATFSIVTTAPAGGDKRLPIFVGALAQQKFGPTKVNAAYEQGFRVVAGKSGIGLLGESDLATSYAIYEVLDRLGCRWYIPSSMGEVIPQLPSMQSSP